MGLLTLLDEPHHDGSALHVSPGPYALGDTVTVSVRVPHASSAEEVHVRRVVDGEPRFTAARVVRRDAAETWWSAEICLANPVTRYRFLLEGADAGYCWLTAGGVRHHDVPDVEDFAITTFAPPPAWLDDTVLYQVFPDRFAASGIGHPVPDWAIATPWDAPVAPQWRDAVRQIYGGDLVGLHQRLDHLEALGVTAVYLTPFFPAPSSHRYNASTFDHVDPLLGGDEALAALTAAAHQRGIRMIGDLTTNHSGSEHAWFATAQGDADSPEAGFYWFEEHPDEYVGWSGVRSLPKFNLESAELRRRLVAGPDSIVARWLRPPYSLDGWRVDVANMTGRLGAQDVNHDVARDMRATMAEVNPDTWLVAEHCYDASADLAGDGWHGTMAYAWFTRPMWCWLQGESPKLMGFPNPPPRFDGERTMASMRAMAAVVPWQSFRASMTLLDSHDTARFATVTGDRGRHTVGLAALMTYPGVPMVFAGDEVGVRGGDGDAARAPFPWDESAWDHELLAAYRTLIAIRRGSDALCRGGLRWVAATADALVYVRESPVERVLVHLARAPHEPIDLDAGALGVHAEAQLLHGTSRLVPVHGRVVLPGDGPAAHLWRLDP